jgi:excisionase family DNA binding protein
MPTESHTATNEQLLKPGEVAERCRCSSKTVMRAIMAGELEASQLGRRGTWVVRVSAIDEWLERRSNRVRPPRPLPDVRRVNAEARPAPAGAPPRRSRPGDGSGRLAA